MVKNAERNEAKQLRGFIQNDMRNLTQMVREGQWLEAVRQARCISNEVRAMSALAVQQQDPAGETQACAAAYAN